MKNTNKILILTERFFPEEFLINDLVRQWCKKEESIEVLTQIPSYPFDRIFQGYRNKLFQTTTEFESVRIRRVRTVLGYNKSVKLRILNYLSFAFLTSLYALFFGWRYKRVFVYHTGPLTLATAAIILRWLWRCRCVIWTQDLWPDAVYAYGFRPNAIEGFLLNSYVQTIYAAMNVIMVSSHGFINRLESFLQRKSVRCVHQWSTEILSIPEKKNTEKVIFMFAGNVATAQNLEKVLSAFGKSNMKNAELHIVGDGIMLDTLKRQAAKNSMTNVFFHGRHPQCEMVNFYKKADVFIISLKATVPNTLPGKFQTYIAAGRPLLGIINGDTATYIQKYDLGVVASPDDENSMIKAFHEVMKNLEKKSLQWRNNCLQLSQEQFSRECSVNELYSTLTKG